MKNMVYRKGGVTLKLRNGGNSTHFLTSREWDAESQTYHHRIRNNDPRIGRFLSADPIGYEGGINLYSYVQNNPVNKTDPSGLGIVFGTVTIDESCCRYHCCDQLRIAPEKGTQLIKAECKSYDADAVYFGPRYPEPRVLQVHDNCWATITCSKYCTFEIKHGCVILWFVPASWQRWVLGKETRNVEWYNSDKQPFGIPYPSDW